MATILCIRGPLSAEGAHLFSVLLRLTPAEVKALNALPVLGGDLGAALMTVEFAPRLVRRQDDELAIDYVSDTNNAAHVGEFCRLAIESRLVTSPS